MADNKVIQSQDVIQPNLFDNTIQSTVNLLKSLSELEKQLISIAGLTKTQIVVASPQTLEAMKSLHENARLANEIFTQRQKVIEQTRIAEAKLTESVSQESQELARLRLEIERVNKENKEQAKAASITTGEYEKASIRLNQVRKAWKDLAIVQKENTAEAKALKKELDQLDATLKKVDAAAGQHHRSVGNYAGGFNGLQNAINQVTRELPAFTNSFQTGFMGISNNLPILADNIANIRKQNAELLAQGIKAPSVFKQLVGSLLSWNTAMSVGITLLTVYSKDIGEFLVDLFAANEAFNEALYQQQTYNELKKKSIESTAQEVAAIQQLVAVAENENLTKEERLVAIRKLNEINPYYQNTLTLETVNTQAATDATNEYIKALNRKALAEAFAAKRADLLKKEVDILTRPLEDNLSALNKAKLSLESTYTSDVTLLRKTYKAALEDREKAIKGIKAEKDALDALQKAKAEAGEMSITDPNEEAKIKSDAEKKAEEERKKAADKARKAQEKLDKERLDAEKKQLELERAARMAKIELIENDIKREIALIEEKTRVQIENNNKEYGNNVKTWQLNQSLREKANQDIQKLLKIKAEADKIELISQDEIRKVSDKAEDYRQKQAEKRKIANEKEAKELEKLALSSAQKLTDIGKSFYNGELNRIDKSIDANKKRQDELTRLAENGSQDAINNLAYERRREAQLEAEREKKLKRMKQLEQGLAAVKVFSSLVDKGQNPLTAAGTTAGIVGGLNSIISSLPTFEDGTEDTGNNGNIDGRGGFHAVLHPNERVLTKKQNDPLLKMGVSNEEIPDLVQKGLLYKLNFAPMSAFDRLPVQDGSIFIKSEQLATMNSKLDTLTDAINSKPVVDQAFDEVSKMILTTYRENNRKIITRSKPYYG